jgi:hypothetical protein
MSKISLICGSPPACDRCGEEGAKVVVILPTYGARELCEKCVLSLLERGLKRKSDNEVS